MKRQIESHGVVAKWVAKPLDVDPFRMPAHFTLQRAGLLSRIMQINEKVVLAKKSILFRTYYANQLISQKLLKVKEFSGIALRISTSSDNIENYSVSVNLHHKLLKYCFPLHFAADLDFSSARLQSWSKVLGLPILLPEVDGKWYEPQERLGRLIIGTTCERSNQSSLRERRSYFSSYRETFSENMGMKVSGREMIARD